MIMIVPSSVRKINVPSSYVQRDVTTITSIVHRVLVTVSFDKRTVVHLHHSVSNISHDTIISDMPYNIEARQDIIPKCEYGTIITCTEYPEPGKPWMKEDEIIEEAKKLNQEVINDFISEAIKMYGTPWSFNIEYSIYTHIEDGDIRERTERKFIAEY